MERKFYHENFEGSLKHEADQFKMYPSKKVWHGIYNDVHPGRRWPSAAISILFIFTLVIIGHLNTANPPGSISRTKPMKEILAANKKSAGNPDRKNLIHPVQANTRKSFPSNNPFGIIQTQSTVNGDGQSEIASQNNLTPGVEPLTQPSSSQMDQKIETPIQDLSNNSNNSVLQNPGISDKSTRNDLVVTDLPSLKITNEPRNTILSDIILPINKNTAKLPSPETEAGKKITEETVNQQSIAKQTRLRRNKISLTMFLAPSLSYRTYSKSKKPADLNMSLNQSAANNTYDNAIERPSLGLKGGASVNYNLTKKLKFIGGMQLGYSEFNKKASNIHPTIASLVLTNSATGVPYTLTTFSHFGSRSEGPVEFNLHNYVLEASTPIGFQYQVGGNDDLNLDVFTTFQPTYVIKSQAYLLSSNNKYFISEPSLSRKWNMGISIGSLISFGSGSYRWQVGPNIDYHLLSTYDSRYQIKEHIINYGVRMGVTKIRK
jgi:hypothetical protein